MLKEKSTLIKSYKQDMDKVKALTSELREAQTRGMSSIVEVLKALISSNELLEAISWNQYTPYFNDGEACTFNIHDLEFKLTGDSEFVDAWSIDDHIESKKDVLDFESSTFINTKELIKSLNEIHSDLIDVSSALQEEFGDHSRVTVTKKGIEFEEYEHD